MVIRQTHAKGPFVDMLLQAVALDDVVSLVSYSVAICIALAVTGGGSAITFGLVAAPIAANLGVMALGAIFGVLLKLLMPGSRSKDNRLIISLAVLFAFCGVCALLNVSPLLGCMSMGMVYINISGDEKLFRQLNYFGPPVMLLFFVRAGLDFEIRALFSAESAVAGVPLVVIGGAYSAVRMAGKCGGSYLGGVLTKSDRNVRRYFGLGLTPQGGVTIGMAALCARTLNSEVGQNLQTIILAASVIYELVGPACVKLSLYLAGTYSDRLEDLTVAPAESAGVRDVDVLIARIRQIQAQLPELSAQYVDEDEQAFLEGEAAQYGPQGRAWRKRFWRRE